MKQQTFSDIEYSNRRKKTKREEFLDAMDGICRFLKQSNIRKEKGGSIYDIFQFLLLLVFQNCNLFHFLNSKKRDMAFSKNTYYRFLNELGYNWQRFLSLLSLPG